MAVSFLERMISDAFNIGLTTTKNTVTGATRRMGSAKGWRNRGRDVLSSIDPRNGMAKGAYDDMVDHWARSKNGWGYAGAALATPVHAGHMALGAVGDVARAAGGIAGTAAGTVLGGAVRGAAGAGYVGMKYGVIKPGWLLTKHVGVPVAKAGTRVGILGVGAAADIGAATAKGIWKTRNNPLVGSALVMGAIGVGATMGNNDFQERAEYGSPYGGRYGTQKGFGYMNTQITGGAWQLNANTPLTASAQELQNRINEQGGYEGIHTTKGPMGDQGGATGDLVFALNQLRQGGLF